MRRRYAFNGCERHGADTVLEAVDHDLALDTQHHSPSMFKP
jgi:hypothetical protein